MWSQRWSYIEIGNTRIALHQLGSGILQKGCTVILGKNGPPSEDLVSEIKKLKK
jgi:adenylosuccinate synthase